MNPLGSSTRITHNFKSVGNDVSSSMVERVVAMSSKKRVALFLKQNGDGVNLLYRIFSHENSLFDEPIHLDTKQAETLLDALGSELICECLKQKWTWRPDPLFHSICHYAKSDETLLVLLEHIPEGHEVFQLKNESGQTPVEVLKARCPSSTDMPERYASLRQCIQCIEKKQAKPKECRYNLQLTGTKV